MKRNPRLQHMLPTKQQIKRDLSDCDPLPAPTLRWMCPSCDNQHVTERTFLTYYGCKCGWEGTRIDLLLGRTQCLTMT